MAADWNFKPPAGFKRLFAYGDVNCPFCYVLEERLSSSEVAVQIEWRLVEHAPELPVVAQDFTATEAEGLRTELEALGDRAPDVAIAPPPFRPSSAAAIRAVAEANRIDIHRADQFRLGLYRALWKHGRNIADPDVIAGLAQEAGLPPLPSTSAAEAEAAAWTAEWRASKLDRIPCLISNVDAKLIGLTSLQRLEIFLQSGLFGSTSEDGCATSSDTNEATPRE